MKRPTLYLETSVPSYLAARPSRDMVTQTHQQITREWWDTKGSRYSIYVSETVIEEISAGDSDAAARRLELVRPFPILQANKKVEELTARYLRELTLPSEAIADAAHLAFASVYEIDFVVTWNCRHIARASVKRGLPYVNRAIGLASPTICTPEEMLYEDD